MENIYWKKFSMKNYKADFNNSFFFIIDFIIGIKITYFTSLFLGIDNIFLRIGIMLGNSFVPEPGNRPPTPTSVSDGMHVGMDFM